MTGRRARGFTLIETVITIAVVGAITVAVSTLIVEMFQSYSSQQQFADQDTQTRLALERILRDVREARLPTDLNAPGATLVFTDITNVSITYALSGTQLQRNGNTLADGVSALSFSYFDNAGASLAAAAGTRYIAVQFTQTTQDGIANTVRGVVSPRNFP